MKRLFVIVDMQEDFVRGALGSGEARAALPRLIALLERARAAGSGVVFTMDTHGEDYLSTQEGRVLPVVHCVRGTAGWQLVSELCRRESEPVFEKGTFGSVELAKYVAAGGYDDVVLAGVCTDICVVSNALLIKAFSPEARLTAAADACAGTSPAAHEAALATMRSCQIRTATVSELTA